MDTYRIKIRIKGEKVDPRTSWTDHIDILVRSHTVPDISVSEVTARVHYLTTYLVEIYVRGEKRDPMDVGTDRIDFIVQSHSVPDISVHKVKSANLDLEDEDLIDARSR